ncbi:MAG TPA: TlpA disulfide reductase family protein [Ktedonobacteraceae bacterium]|nr:TlpA disulfide reductase family protein [Ktedonobacteraceae bacterium]
MQQLLLLSSILLWVLVLVNLILTLALVRRINSMYQPRNSLKEGQPAPHFSAETLRGETVTLESFTGRNIAFIFIEPACGPCREALPSYEYLGPKAARANVDLVLVSTADSERTRRFVDEFNITLPILIAPHDSNPFTKDYLVSGTPAYCLIDTEGKVQSTGSPNLKWGKWKGLAEAWERQVEQSTV